MLNYCYENCAPFLFVGRSSNSRQLIRPCRFRRSCNLSLQRIQAQRNYFIFCKVSLNCIPCKEEPGSLLYINRNKRSRGFNMCLGMQLFVLREFLNSCFKIYCIAHCCVHDHERRESFGLFRHPARKTGKYNTQG